MHNKSPRTSNPCTSKPGIQTLTSATDQATDRVGKSRSGYEQTNRSKEETNQRTFRPSSSVDDNREIHEHNNRPETLIPQTPNKRFQPKQRQISYLRMHKQTSQQQIDRREETNAPSVEIRRGITGELQEIKLQTNDSNPNREQVSYPHLQKQKTSQQANNRCREL